MNAAYTSALPVIRPGYPELDYPAARLAMLEGQLRPNNIVEPRVLDAFATIPREAFLPSDFGPLAYNDRELQIAADHFLMSPTLLAKLFEAAAPNGTERALVLCAGNGYPAAIAGGCFADTVAVSPHGDDSKQLRNILLQLSIENVTGKTGHLAKGWARLGPYDVIILAGAAADIPPALFDQLAPGGKIIGVFPDEQHTLRGMVYLKLHDTLSRRIICDGTASFLPGLAPQPHFTF